MSKGYTTRSLHTALPKTDAYGSLHMPVYDGVSFEFESADEMAKVFSGQKIAHAYSRTSNPTVEYFERKLKAVTNSHAVLAMSSGMASISSAIIALVENGGNILASNHLFGHTYAFFKQTLPSLGIDVRFVDVNNLADLDKNRDSKTRMVFFETITNPQLEIVDIEIIAKWAHQHNIIVMVDSTTTPPYIFNSAKLGVDVEVMSTTKFISGGATVFGGAVIDNGTFSWDKVPALSSWIGKFGKDAFMARLRKEVFRHMGGAMTPQTAHYMNLGMDILALRVDKCVENTYALASFLEEQPQVESVNYPGLKSNVGYALSEKQFYGKPGAILTLSLANTEACYAFMDKLEIVRRATNLSDNKTLIIHPFSTIYSEFSVDERLEMGVSPSLMRLSVGIEDIEDLKSDILQALKG